MTDTAVPAPRAEPTGGRLRSRLLTTVLLLPAALWYLVLLVLPLVDRRHLLVRRPGEERRLRAGASSSTTTPGPSRSPSRSSPACRWRSSGTIGCLLVGLPLAYFIATRAGRRKGLFVLLLVIPFWTSFLIRTYAWLIILGPDIGLAGPARARHRRRPASRSSARRSPS